MTTPNQYRYDRITQKDTNNFFEWTARHEKPMVLDSKTNQNRLWLEGDPVIPTDMLMWIDSNGVLNNSAITLLQQSIATQATQIATQAAQIATQATQIASLQTQLQTLLGNKE